MRSISRSESEPNSSRLDDNEARGELLSMLRHKVRHHGREIGARVRWKACRLSGCVDKLPEITVLGEENPGWPWPRLRRAQKILSIQLTKWIDA
jgi:hypothetical protein